MKRQRRNQKTQRRKTTAAVPALPDDSGGRKPLAARPQRALVRSVGPWPYRLAILLPGLTLVTIWLGALVTTLGAGMAAPDWPRGLGLDLIGLRGPLWILGSRAELIEGAHRLCGALVLAVAIGLLIVVWRHDRRRSKRTLLGLTALALAVEVSLGVARVVLESDGSARLHAGFGVLLLSLLVALAVAHSPDRFRSSTETRHRDRRGLRRLVTATALVAAIQVILGTCVRHYPITAGPATFRLLGFCHLGCAALLIVHIVLVAWLGLRRRHAETRPLRWATACLVAAAVLQPVLGAGAWIVRFGWPSWAYSLPGVAGFTISTDGPLAVQLVSAHVTNAALLLAATVWILAELRRGTWHAEVQQRSIGH